VLVTILMSGSKVGLSLMGSVPWCRHWRPLTRGLFVKPFAALHLLPLAILWWTSPVAAAPRQLRVEMDLRENVARGTRVRYAQSYQALQTWLTDHQLPPMCWWVVQPVAQLNEILMIYVQHLYDEHVAYTHAPFTLAAIQHFHRSLYGQLRPAWQSVKAWKHAEPGELRAPIPVSLLWGLMVLALATNMASLAVLLALGHHCLLRPGEMCRLERRHVRLPGDAGWHSNVGIVIITDPKTARTAARVQHVVIHDRIVLLLCQAVWGHLPPRQALAPGNIRCLEGWFRWAMVCLGLKERQFTPAGLRAGGATHDYLAGSPVERLMWRGRWAALSTLKHYVQECASVLATATMPPVAQSRLMVFEEFLASFLSALTGSWQ
jgi:hypothetical protein